MENIILGIISLALCVYLIVAMIRPGKILTRKIFMNAHQWLELVLYLGALIARHQTARPLPRPRFRRERKNLSRPGFSPAGKTDLLDFPR
jgi:K+-transporting ATPase KdpF subunit